MIETQTIYYRQRLFLIWKKNCNSSYKKTTETCKEINGLNWWKHLLHRKLQRFLCFPNSCELKLSTFSDRPEVKNSRLRNDLKLLFNFHWNTVSKWYALKCISQDFIPSLIATLYLYRHTHTRTHATVSNSFNIP